jgi:hypothetical protein
MAKVKTTVSEASVEDFLNSLADERKRDDSFALLKLYREVTGEKPTMWGSSIVGFGTYHFKSERSSQEGDWPLAAFSPRKQSLTLYVDPERFFDESLYGRLGKHTTSKACLYINRLSDVDEGVLRKIVKHAFTEAKKTLSAQSRSR